MPRPTRVRICSINPNDIDDRSFDDMIARLRAVEADCLDRGYTNLTVVFDGCMDDGGEFDVYGDYPDDWL